MKEIYVVHVKKSIEGREEAYPIECTMLLGKAQAVLSKYISDHKAEVSAGDEWLAEETQVTVYNMMTEVTNRKNLNRIEVRIYVFYLNNIEL